MNLNFRRTYSFTHPPPRSDPTGSRCWLWPPDVSAAVWHQHGYVSSLSFYLSRANTETHYETQTIKAASVLTGTALDGCFSVCRYYSATILQMAGVRDDKQAIWLAAATSATNFVFTLVGVWLVERVGRRKLTLGSLLGLANGWAWITFNSSFVTLLTAFAPMQVLV